MFKKIELWIVILICILLLIFTIFYGALLRDHYLGVDRFQKLKKIAVFFAQIPTNIKQFKTMYRSYI